VLDLYAITSERSTAEIERGVQRALATPEAARIGVLLRAKHLAAAEQRGLGRSLRELTRERGAKLLVSADLALCEELGADGVQLPERGPSIAEARARLGTARLIGASRHDAAGLARAASEGASFATLSPVHASPFKGEPLGAMAFASLVSAAQLPVLALGGIETHHVRELVLGGAAGIAAIRAIFDHPDPASAVRAFLTEIDQARALLPIKQSSRRL